VWRSDGVGHFQRLPAARLVGRVVVRVAQWGREAIWGSTVTIPHWRGALLGGAARWSGDQWRRLVL
jgi:hypothetical protein